MSRTTVTDTPEGLTIWVDGEKDKVIGLHELIERMARIIAERRMEAALLGGQDEFFCL